MLSARAQEGYLRPSNVQHDLGTSNLKLANLAPTLTQNDQVTMTQHPAPDGSSAERALIVDSLTPKKLIKKESNSPPSLAPAKPDPPFNWDDIEIHIDLGILGNPAVTFLMAGVMPIHDKKKSDLQPIDFKRDSLIEILKKEVNGVMNFDEKVHRLVYVDDLGPVTLSNPGSYPLVLRRFMNSQRRRGNTNHHEANILHFKVDHAIPSSGLLPITALPHTYTRCLTEKGDPQRYETGSVGKEPDLSVVDARSSSRDAAVTQPRTQVLCSRQMSTMPYVRGLSIHENFGPNDTNMQQHVAAPALATTHTARRPAAASRVIILRSQKLDQIRVSSPDPTPPQYNPRPQSQIIREDLRPNQRPFHEDINDPLRIQSEQHVAAAGQIEDANEATQEWTDTDSDSDSDSDSSSSIAESDSSQDPTYEEPASLSAAPLSSSATRRSSTRIAKNHSKRKATRTPSPAKASPWRRPGKLPRRYP